MNNKFLRLIFFVFLISALPIFSGIFNIQKVRAAGGIYASGSGTKTVGQIFTVNVAASGATFNALEGTISVSGQVQVLSFSPGGATWITQPSNGSHFVGMLTSPSSSLTVATIKLKATGVGTGAVNVSSVQLANAGEYVGNGAGSASFTIEEGADLPGLVKVSSSSHPDPNASYEETTIVLSWQKDSGVLGFSYLLDQTADTTPPASITSSDTSITYENKGVGTWFFHIRAQKSDGWGSTTHFQVNIKEPDAKIDETLKKPSNIKVTKSKDFKTKIREGLVSGIIISGRTEPGFTANLTLNPGFDIPEGRTLSAQADNSGNFEYLIDYFIPSGHYILTVQGQKEKVLTPVSDEVIFEISLANGGKVSILNAGGTSLFSIFERVANSISNSWLTYLIVLVILLIIFGIAFWLYLKVRKSKNEHFNLPI